MPLVLERKLVKTGSSTTINVPYDWLRTLKLKAGDVVELICDSVIIVRRKDIDFDAEALKKEIDLLHQVNEASITEAKEK